MNKAQTDSAIKQMGWGLSLLFFGIPSIALIMTTYVGMPWLQATTGIMPILNWFIMGGLCVLAPLFFAAILFYRRDEGSFVWSEFKVRCRLKRMTGQDWWWAVGALIAAPASSGIITFIWQRLHAAFDSIPQPDTSVPFLEYNGLEEGQLWILGVWVLFFFFNIFGEELWWRGYILPRQEVRFGKHAWVVNGLFWLMFHVAFGWKLMLVIWPIQFILPYAVQKRRNTWIGIFVHGIYNGPIFIAISLKWI